MSTGKESKKKPKKPGKAKAPQAGPSPAQNPPALPPKASAQSNDALDQALDPKAIANLDLNQLRQSMTKGIYVLEAVLFSQAQFEFARVRRQRSIVEKLEDEIFDQKTLAQLTPAQKAALYHTAQQAMSSSLNFLTDLHDNVASGLEAVNQIEKLSAGKNSGASKARDPNVEKARMMIRQQMLAKVQARKPEDSGEGEGS